jgi:hypothetical protein
MPSFDERGRLGCDAHKGEHPFFWKTSVGAMVTACHETISKAAYESFMRDYATEQKLMKKSVERTPENLGLTPFENQEWLRKNHPHISPTSEDFAEISRLLDSIVRWYCDDSPVGGFLQAVLTNDLKRSVGTADECNARNLKVYVEFLYNQVPEDYIKKAAKDFE